MELSIIGWEQIYIFLIFEALSFSRDYIFSLHVVGGLDFHNICPSLFSLDDDVSCSLVRVLSLDDDVSCSVVRVLSHLVLLSSHRWILSLPLNSISTSTDFKRERGKKDFED